MGAVCEACDQDMEVALTCKAEERPGVTLYTQDLPAEHYQPLDVELLPFRCRDCGVVKGGVHHVFCCVAGCLNCGYAQRLDCPCDCGDEAEDDDAEAE